MDSTAYLKTLYPKLISGVLTETELDWLLAYFETGDPEALYALVRTELTLPDAEIHIASAAETATLQRVYAQVEQAFAPAKTPSPKISRLRRWLPYAAATVAILLTVGLAFWDKEGRIQEPGFAATEILPGGNRATLTLPDGTIVALDETQTGIIIGDGDIRYQDGTAIDAATHHPSPITYHVLSTPKGGQYQVTLPDGSRVWLNAASTLKYPSRFEGQERIVELEGEAYFEVMQMRNPANQPFRVVSKGQTVEVLGTSFNISAYSDNPATQTTLIEGKVRVASNTSGVTLSPGQQSTIRVGLPGQETKTTIAEVDIQKYIAWKQGQFRFTGETLGGAMRQIARWYDVEVVFADATLQQAPISGIINRDENLSELLSLLERIGDVQFKLQERELTISRK